MSELADLARKQKQTFVLVCINLALFLVLFAGLGYVTWQSAALVNRLQQDLEKAEQAIARMQDRFHNMDMDVLVDRVVTAATASLGEAVREVVRESDFAAPLAEASERLENARENMEHTREVMVQTGEAIQGINETVQGLDNEEIARLVSYHMLKGLGEGFDHAAETRKPEGLKVSE